MKKETFVTILLIIISLQLSAQRYKDALYLKNGSIIYGKLLEISDNKYKIQIPDGSLIIYPESDVDKLLKELPAFQGRRTEGLGMSLEAGLLLGAQNSEFDAPFSFNFLGNYAIKTKNIVGIGSGVEFIGVPFVPLFVEYKYIVKDSKASPFFFARGGGLIHLADNTTDNDPYLYNKHNYRGGFSATIGIGIIWAKEDVEPYLSFAYRYCRTSYKQTTYVNGNYDYDFKFENNYNRLEMKFGFRF